MPAPTATNSTWPVEFTRDQVMRRPEPGRGSTPRVLLPAAEPRSYA
ncbi:hypothetical protein [Nocardioides nematodiphilus]|nr:hypothetical protein [Nocardioides nematodiphilus]MCA1983390.1 hypothetical protein [Nocardioides nematodiphilus]